MVLQGTCIHNHLPPPQLEGDKFAPLDDMDAVPPVGVLDLVKVASICLRLIRKYGCIA